MKLGLALFIGHFQFNDAISPSYDFGKILVYDIMKQDRTILI